jgi:hypothetical protein
MKQGRQGAGRSKASRARGRSKALHSRARQSRRRSLPALDALKGKRTPGEWPGEFVARTRRNIGRVAAHESGGPAREGTLEQSEVHERGVTAFFTIRSGRWTWEDPEGPANAAKTEGGSSNQYDDTASAERL